MMSVRLRATSRATKKQLMMCTYVLVNQNPIEHLLTVDEAGVQVAGATLGVLSTTSNDACLRMLSKELRGSESLERGSGTFTHEVRGYEDIPDWIFSHSRPVWSGIQPSWALYTRDLSVIGLSFPTPCFADLCGSVSENLGHELSQIMDDIQRRASRLRDSATSRQCDRKPCLPHLYKARKLHLACVLRILQTFSGPIFCWCG